jgi:hypothetical protein
MSISIYFSKLEDIIPRAFSSPNHCFFPILSLYPRVRDLLKIRFTGPSQPCHSLSLIRCSSFLHRTYQPLTIYLLPCVFLVSPQYNEISISRDFSFVTWNTIWSRVLLNQYLIN